MKGNTLLVGLAGGSAVGKTTLIKFISDKYADNEVCILSLDHYYKPLSKQLRDANGVVNFDHPEGIDFRRVRKDIRQLMSGNSVKLVEYTFNNPDIFPKQLILHPAKILLVEGLFAFADKLLMKMYQLKVMITADRDLALQRRIRRDTKERGMDKEMILYQWQNHVLPAYKKFLDPHLGQVEITLDNSNTIEEEIHKLTSRFDQILTPKQ